MNSGIEPEHLEVVRKTVTLRSVSTGEDGFLVRQNFRVFFGLFIYFRPFFSFNFQKKMKCDQNLRGHMVCQNTHEIVIKPANN